MQRNNYYTNRTEKLVQDFSRLIKKNRQVLERRFGDVTGSMVAEILLEYQALIPHIPYIGGRKNRLTRNLVGSAQLLSVIRVLENKSLAEREIGAILFEIYESHLSSLPAAVKFILGKIYLTRFWRKRMEKNASRSQLRKYPDDWVAEYVPGGGADCIFGMNYYECGICKFYQRMGAGKYVPYLCLLDYPLFSMLAIRLVRTETLGNGAARCDFRFHSKGPSVKGWPPESVEEFRGGSEQSPHP